MKRPTYNARYLGQVVGVLISLNLVMSLNGIYCSYMYITDSGDIASEDENYLFVWTQKPSIIKSEGEKREVSNVIYTGSESNAYTVTQSISHTFNVKKGAEIDLKGLMTAAGVKLGFSIDVSSGKQTALNHKISIDKYSKGKVMFTEKLITIVGRAVRRNKRNWFTCYMGGALPVAYRNCALLKEKEFEIEVTATEIDSSGNAMGAYSVEYIGTSRYRHPSFYHILDKATFNTEHDDLPIDEQVNSPHHCAERALLHGFRVALYDVRNMTCYLKYHKENNGSSFDSRGHKLGDYNYVDRQNLDEAATFLVEERDRWRRERKCDLIHEFSPPITERDFDYATDKIEERKSKDILLNITTGSAVNITISTGDSNVDAKSSDIDESVGSVGGDAKLTNLTTIFTKEYLCKLFPVKPRMVLMFQRLRSVGSSGKAQHSPMSTRIANETATRTLSLTRECLNCISFAVTTELSRANDCSNSTICGPFSITLGYWKDGGEPGGQWQSCTKNRECSMVAIKNYMEEYERDCNGDGYISCHDYAAIHRRGPTNCGHPKLLQERYWSKFINCWDRQQL